MTDSGKKSSPFEWYKRFSAPLSVLIILTTTALYALYLRAILRGDIPTSDRLGAAELTFSAGLIFLLLIILNPWLLSQVRSMTLPGGLQVTLQEIQGKLDSNSDKLKKVTDKLKYVLSMPEHYHLKK
jgi:hypothetical protein